MTRKKLNQSAKTYSHTLYTCIHTECLKKNVLLKVDHQNPFFFQKDVLYLNTNYHSYINVGNQNLHLTQFTFSFHLFCMSSMDIEFIQFCYAADRGPLVWEFLVHLLISDKSCPSLISWVNQNDYVFRLDNKEKIASMWANGRSKKKADYNNFARAMRYFLFIIFVTMST